MLKAMVCGSKVRLCWLTFCRNSVVGICVLFECLTVGCVSLVAWLFVESLIVTISWWRSEGVSKFAGILKTCSEFLVGVGAVSVCLVFTVDGVGRGKLCCLTCFSRFILVNPVNFFHFDLVVSFFVLTFSKNSSWLTWNCGDILPVVRFRTKDAVRACLCELPRYRPRVYRGSHLGINFPPWSIASREWTGQLKLWKMLSLEFTNDCEKYWSGESPINIGR